MSSDVESDDNLRRSYDLPKDDDSLEENSQPLTPPRSKLVRQLTTDNSQKDLNNVDASLLNNVDDDSERPNYDTFKVNKTKSTKLPNPSNNTTPVRHVIALSEDSSPKTPQKKLTNITREAEKEMESLLKAENLKLHKTIENNNQTLEDMRRCVIEYESTIKELREAHDFQITEKISAIKNLVCERDQAVQDLSTIEKAFSDLQRRFEKSKDIIDNLYKNQDVLKKHADTLKEELSKSETKYNNLKILTERRLKRANEEVDSARRENETEIARLGAVAKKAELRISTLEKQLTQKIEENEELTKICDELISKYSGHNS